MFGRIVGIISTVYFLALVAFVSDTFGFFEADLGTLAQPILLVLGLPWNQAKDSIPEDLQPWFFAAVPAINLIILSAIAKHFADRD